MKSDKVWLMAKCFELAVNTSKGFAHSDSKQNANEISNPSGEFITIFSKEDKDKIVNEMFSLADLYYRRIDKWVTKEVKYKA